LAQALDAAGGDGGTITRSVGAPPGASNHRQRKLLVRRDRPVKQNDQSRPRMMLSQ